MKPATDEEDALNHLRTLRDTQNCRFLLFEMFVSNDGKGHRAVFIQELFKLAHEEEPYMYVVLDDSMFTVRCGAMFTFLRYRNRLRNVVPDFVVVGKGWGLGAMLWVKQCRTNHGGRLSAPINRTRIREYRGLTTCEMDPIMLLRCLRFIRIVKARNLTHRCLQIQSAVRHFKEDHRPDGDIHAVGAFVWSDIKWYPNMYQLHQRLLPSFTWDPDRFIDILTQSCKRESLRKRKRDPRDRDNANAVVADDV